MKNKIYWLWLNNIKGIGNKKIKYLLDYCGTPNEVWNLNRNELAKCSSITSSDIDNIITSKDINKIQEYEENINMQGINYCTIDEEEYPVRLKNIYDPPYILYYKGKLPDSRRPHIAVVGARKCSDYGRTVAYNISKDLAAKGFVIVSGMARGIDTASHKAAVDIEETTVAVLGTGVDICYPKENLNLMNNILCNGAIISEFPPGMQPLPGNFPLRNRIISGMSDAVVVPEAAFRSGSLITVDQALEQGRDVYAIPGNIYSKNSKGTNNLIKQGCKIVTEVNDIIEDFDINLAADYMPEQIKLKVELEKNQKMIYDYLSFNNSISIDNICRNIELPTNVIQQSLSMLELEDLIIQLPNKRFQKKVL